MIKWGRRILLLGLAALSVILIIALVNTNIKLNKAESDYEALVVKVESSLVFSPEGETGSDGEDIKEAPSLLDYSEEEIEAIIMENEAALTAAQQEQEQLQEKLEEGKVVYLTFDDGPSGNTEEILKTLKKYDAQATFFVTGRSDEKGKKLYNRIIEEGHVVGLHTYSHNYSSTYESVDKFAFEIIRLRQLIFDTTGVDTTLFRFPGGSSNSIIRGNTNKYIKYLNNNNYIYFDWNVSSGDAAANKLSKEQIKSNVIKGIKSVSVPVVLMHDSDAKDTTVMALDEILSELTKEGYIFRAIDMDTEPVQHVKSNID